MGSEVIDRNHLEEEFTQFLNPSAKPEVKKIALDHLLGLTGSQEGNDFIGKSDSLLKGIISLTEDSDEKIVEEAYKTLINLATSEDICQRISNLDIFTEFATKQLTKILDPAFKLADSACKVLSNLTRNSACASTVAKIVLENQAILGIVKIVSALCNLKYNESADLHYLASVLANLAQIQAIRDQVLARDQLVVQKLLPFIEYKESAFRRHGVVSCIRNCCFEPEHHDWLLGDQVDLLPRLLLPLAGGEEFDDDDMEKLPEDLQYLPPEKEREKEPEIRKMLVETVFKLCAKKECRLFIKSKNTYVIMREYHKWEPDKSNENAIMNLIDVLIQDEPEPGMENLHEVVIPDDVKEKFEEKDVQQK